MDDNIVIYLISGKKLHGKDSLYKAGKNIFNWERTAFADKIKEIGQELFDLSDEQVGGKLKEIEDKRYPNYYDQKMKLVNIDVDPKLITSKELKVQQAKKYVPNEQYKEYLSPRRLFQIIGKEFRRLFPEVWVNYVFVKEIPKIVEMGINNVAITDVRFLNEIEFIEKEAEERKIKVVKIRLIRPNLEEDGNSLDESEVELDNYKKWDFIVHNAGTLDDLEKKSKLIFEKLPEVLSRKTHIQTII